MNKQTTNEEFFECLCQHGHVLPSGVLGVFGRGGEYEAVVTGLGGQITALGADLSAEVVRFPPVLSRKVLEQSEFLQSFPHLAGTVSAFEGMDAEHVQLVQALEQQRDWSQFQKMTDLVLAPAACYPVYPLATGQLPKSGRVFDVEAYCFRREPSDDVSRMQSFRMREYVRIADAETVLAWRKDLVERTSRLAHQLGIDGHVQVASDPFFGRFARMMADGQRDMSLKFELLFPMGAKESVTALVSFNYHQDHFGRVFAIKDASGNTAHTACLGFGIDRLVLALLLTHGMSTKRWPESVRQQLAL